MAATPGQEVEVRVTSSGADEAAASLTRMGDAAESMKMKVGAAGAALAAVSAGGIAAATSAASKWNDKVLEMRKVSDAATADKLSEDMRELSETVPLATTKLGDLAADAARFGIKGADNIRNFVSATGKMAAATDLTTDQAGESFAKLATLTDTPIPKIENLGSSINSLGQNFATSASEITKNMMQASGSLSSLGMKNTDIAGLAASMNEMYQSSSMAGRGLRRLSQEMTDPKKVGNLAAALGMTDQKFKQMRSSDPTGLMLRMASAMKQNGKKAAGLRKSLTSFSRMALTNMAKNLDNVRASLNRSGKAYKENTSLQREFEISMESLGAQAQLLKNKIFNAGVSTGQVFLPILLRAVKAVNGAVDRFNDFNDATGGMAGALTLVSGLVTGLYTAFTALSGTAAAATVAEVGFAVSKLVTPLGIAITTLSTLAAAWKSDFAGIRSVTMRVVKALRGTFLKTWTQLKATVLPILSQIGNAFDLQGGRVSSVASGLVQQLGGKLLVTIRQLGDIATRVITWIGKMWSQHGKSILSTIRLISTNLSEMLIQAMAAVRSALGGDFVQMMGAFREFKTAALNIWNALWPAIQRAAKTGLRMAWNWVRTSGVSLAKGALKRLSSAAVGAFQFGKNQLLPAIRTGVGLAWGWVRTRGVAIGKSALGALGRLAVSAFKFGKNQLLPKIRTAFGSAWTWVRTRGATLGKKALGVLSRLVLAGFRFTKNKIVPKVSSALNAAWRWVRTNGVRLGKQALRRLGQQVVQSFNLGRGGGDRLVRKVRTTITGAWSWIRTRGVALGKSALRTLGTAAIQAFTFTKRRIVPPVKRAIGAGWKWIRTRGVALGKGALRVLGRKALAAFTFAKKNIVPKVRTALTAGWRWVRTRGVTLGKGALRFLGRQAVKGFSFTKKTILPKVRTAVNGVWRWVRTRGVALAKNALGFLGRQAVKGLKFGRQNLLPKIRKAISGVVSWLKNKGVALFKGAFRSYGRILGPYLLTELEFVVKAFKTIIPRARNWLRNNGTQIIKRGFKNLGKAIRLLILSPAFILQAFISTVNGVRDWLNSGGKQRVKTAFKNIVSGIVSYLKNDAWGDIKGAAEFLFDGVMAAAEGLYEGLIGNSLVPEMFTDIANYIRNFNLFAPVDALLSSVWRRFDKLKRDALNTISTLLGNAVTAIQNWSLYQKVHSALKSVWLRFNKFKTDAVATIKNTVSGILSAVSPKNLKNKLKNKIGNALDGAKSKFESLYNDVVGNSIVPDMADDVVGVMDRMDMAGPTGREMGRAFKQFAWLQTNAKKRTDKLNTETLNNVKAMARETTKKASSWVGSFVKPFGRAKDRVSGLFSKLHHMVVGGSIVPDMLSDLVSESKGSWAKQFVSPFVSAADRVAGRLSKLRKQAANAAKQTAKHATKAAKSVSGGGGGSSKVSGIPSKWRKILRNYYKHGRVNGRPLSSQTSFGKLARAAKKYADGTWYEDTGVVATSKVAGTENVRFKNGYNPFDSVGGLASGGVVTGPTLSWVGEGRESEAVLPLSRLESMISPQRESGMSERKLAKYIAKELKKGGAGQKVVQLALDGEVVDERVLDLLDEREDWDDLSLKAGTANIADGM